MNFGKLQDLEKLMDELGWIINTMKDLLQHAIKHHIRSRLYSGDGLNRIYQLLSVVGSGATQDTFLKSQGKFLLSFPCTLFYIFLTPKNYNSSL